MVPRHLPWPPCRRWANGQQTYGEPPLCVFNARLKPPSSAVKSAPDYKQHDDDEQKYGVIHRLFLSDQ